MVYTFNPSMEGKDRWNPEFQKPCLQKAKQKQTNKQMNNEPPPTPQKTFAQMFLKPTSSLLQKDQCLCSPLMNYRVLEFSIVTGR